MRHEGDEVEPPHDALSVCCSIKGSFVFVHWRVAFARVILCRFEQRPTANTGMNKPPACCHFTLVHASSKSSSKTIPAEVASDMGCSRSGALGWCRSAHQTSDHLTECVADTLMCVHETSGGLRDHGGTCDNDQPSGALLVFNRAQIRDQLGS